VIIGKWHIVRFLYFPDSIASLNTNVGNCFWFPKSLAFETCSAAFRVTALKIQIKPDFPEFMPV